MALGVLDQPAVGLLGALLGIPILPRTVRPSNPGRFDLAGAALVVPAVALLLLALNEGSRAGFGSLQLIGPVLAAVDGVHFREL